MTTVTEINGIKVNFPFEPYQVQVAYMQKVIETLESGSNAVLESPTGTGKTLSLLCSSLAWLLHRKEQLIGAAKKNPMSGNVVPTREILNWNLPKIYYTSRTHSQITQAVQELKRSSYSFIKAVVIGSRDQMCIHPEVSKEPNNSQKIQLCKVHVINRTCSFYSRIEDKKNRPEIMENTVLDIEDLVTIGRKIKMCPYFGAKEIANDCEIIFMPYNYLIDPGARRANNIQLKNSIIIFDEAHNVEKMCEEAASVRIKSSDIALAIDDVTFVMKMLDEGQAFLEIGGGSEESKDFSIEDLAVLKEMLLKFEQEIDEVEVPNKALGNTFNGDFIVELYSNANMKPACFPMVLDLLDKVLSFLATVSQKNSVFRKGIGLQIFASLTTVVFDSLKDNRMEKMKRSFKVHFDVEEIKQSGSANKDGWISKKMTTKLAKVVNFWCFNPGFGMEYLLNSQVRSIILTSGTLAPLKPLIAELGIPITYTLENPHIIKPSQIFVKIVSHGPDREKLISNYENRDNPKYINSLGGTIANFCNIIPDGVLVFFPSYAIMNKCVSSWQASGIFGRISKRKPIFVEPQGKDAFNSTMAEFYDKINNPAFGGACFFAVCRGKVSEGLDFADANGRAVLITGLPFPPFKDPRIILKRQYLEQNRTRENQLLSGQDWYFLEATRAVNQAIGRVIRHKDDYGAILLCDVRFGSRTQQSQLSSWIQKHLKFANDSENNFGKIMRELKIFFTQAKGTPPKLTPQATFTSQDCSSTSSCCIQDISLYEKKERTKIVLNSNNENLSATEQINKFNLLEYKNAKIEKQKLDFSSRLYEESTSSVINFNDQIADQPTISSPLFIKKRERLSSGDDVTSPRKSPDLILKNFSKKRKLKLIPNAPRVELAETTTKSETYSFDKLPEVKSEIPIENMDRFQFLTLIRQSLSPANIKKFNKSLIGYRDHDNIELFFGELCDVFGTAAFLYLLKGSRRYIKNHHKQKFDQLLENYLKSKEF